MCPYSANNDRFLKNSRIFPDSDKAVIKILLILIDCLVRLLASNRDYRG